ncbi:MAG TPA: M48 family metallopeptidase [Pyrinomonadaceae bacterium]
MSRHFSRTMTALTLVASLWASSLAVVAAPQQQQPSQTQTAAQQPAAKTESKDKKDSKNQKTTATAPANNKPLSEKEDPRLIGKRKINKGIIASMSTSLEKEVALGRQLAAEVDRQAKFVDDPIITEYVNRVGQNVVLHSDAKIPFTIKVIDTDEANAFALPGGFFYVNKGLILAADNEAELAGVMAHEIAHVTARHAVENQTKGMLADIGLTVGSIFLGGIGGALILNGAQLGALAGFMKFNRDAESEADRLGAQYLYAAGYDPGSMSTMFEKLLAKNKKKPGFLSKMFATHPQTADRMEASRMLVARFPDREEYVLSTSEFQRVKGRLMRLSNARASTVGDITAAGTDGAPGRPTLKRRQPPPESDGTSTTPDGQKPVEEKAAPPVLKRRDAPPATTQPGTTTTTNP